ncbi:putative benzoate:H+ symporter BenE [Arthrobacter sp. CAN_A212]
MGVSRYACIRHQRAPRAGLAPAVENAAGDADEWVNTLPIIARHIPLRASNKALLGILLPTFGLDKLFVGNPKPAASITFVHTYVQKRDIRPEWPALARGMITPTAVGRHTADPTRARSSVGKS